MEIYVAVVAEHFLLIVNVYSVTVLTDFFSKGTSWKLCRAHFFCFQRTSHSPGRHSVWSFETAIEPQETSCQNCFLWETVFIFESERNISLDLDSVEFSFKKQILSC